MCSMILNQNGITFTMFLFSAGALVSLFFLACSRLLAMSWYLFFNISRESIFSSVPKYLTAGAKSEFSRTIGSLPNVRLSFQCSFGKKLYVVQSNDTTWCHTRDFDTCLDIHALRKLWNPSILPFD